MATFDLGEVKFGDVTIKYVNDIAKQAPYSIPTHSWKTSVSVDIALSADEMVALVKSITPVDDGTAQYSAQVGALRLPGVGEAADYPCECGGFGGIYSIVIHLNDAERWNREQIADWLETLDIDMEFK